jgi:hypothetical protein
MQDRAGRQPAGQASQTSRRSTDPSAFDNKKSSSNLVCTSDLIYSRCGGMQIAWNVNFPVLIRQAASAKDAEIRTVPPPVSSFLPLAKSAKDGPPALILE